MKTIICFTVLILLESPKALGAVGIQIPFGMEGNASLPGPFNGGPLGNRVQQVYRSGAFPGLSPTSAFLIEGVYFRIDENGGTFDETFPSVQVNLSTTGRGPDGLSTLFSENIGANETVVFGPGPLHLSGSQPGFTVGFMFSQPFLYNPAAGNLLLDIRNFGPGNASILDAFAVFGDSVSTVSTGLGANQATGGLATIGLATLFWVDIVPVPEPSATGLLFLGVVALGWKLHRSLKSSSTQG